jgi:hypothetical protein
VGGAYGIHRTGEKYKISVDNLKRPLGGDRVIIIIIIMTYW